MNIQHPHPTPQHLTMYHARGVGHLIELYCFWSSGIGVWVFPIFWVLRVFQGQNFTFLSE